MLHRYRIVSTNIDDVIKSAFWYWINGSYWGNANNIALSNDFLKVTMAINGGYNNVVERNEALIILYSKFNIQNCDVYDKVCVREYTFNNSQMINTNWYRNHPTEVARVERELTLFYSQN